MTNIMYGLRLSPESRRQYPARLKVYLDFLGLKGKYLSKRPNFLEKAKTDAVWAQGGSEGTGKYTDKLPSLPFATTIRRSSYFAT